MAKKIRMTVFTLLVCLMVSTAAIGLAACNDSSGNNTDQNAYTLSFDANGGSISGESTQIKLFGKSLKYVKSVNGIWAENEEYALPTASKSNCNFDGWNSEAAGGGSGISITRAI